MRSVFLALSASLLLSSCSNQPSVNKPTSDQGNSVPAPTIAANKIKPTPEAVSVNPAADSIYSDISEKVCKEREPEPDSGAIYESECPGVAGYKLIFSASDHSQVLSVIDPQGKETLLSFRLVLNTVSDFVLGNKVEWRMDGKGRSAKPQAMIVRLTRFSDPEDPNKTESFLAVVRLAGETCVTDLVPASADQNVKAREFADNKGRKCMELKRE